NGNSGISQSVDASSTCVTWPEKSDIFDLSWWLVLGREGRPSPRMVLRRSGENRAENAPKRAQKGKSARTLAEPSFGGQGPVAWPSARFFRTRRFIRELNAFRP